MLNTFLSGIKLIDLSQYLPGPFAASILGDLGADVLKVEPPEGDPARRMPPLDPDGVAGMYKLLNCNKRTVRVDLKAEAGKRQLTELLALADVLLESYRPGVLDRLGFTRRRLEEINPRLVHCALSGFGQTGPLKHAPGHDLNYLALCGGLDMSGTAATPVITFPPVADHASGQLAALTTVGALFRRAATGQGCFIDVSIAETVLAWQTWPLAAASYPGQAVSRGAGLINGGTAYYRIYRTNDNRFVTLGAIEPKFWANFCVAVERPDWVDRQAEPAPQSDLIAEVERLFAAQPLRYWEEKLGKVECCFQGVLKVAELPGHPHIQARKLMTVHQEGGRQVQEALFPAWIDGHPPAVRKPWREAGFEEALGSWQKPS